MRALLLALAVALTAAGCARADDPGAPPAGPSAPASTAPASSPPAGTAPASSAPGAITVDGVVEKGVEPGCLVLRAGGRSYTLQGATDVPLGVPVRVTGAARTDQASYCQQGTPLDVTSVTTR